MANYKVNDIPISDLIESGGETDTNTQKYTILNTPLKYISTTYAFEKPSLFNFKFNDVDIANSMVATYTNYTVNTTLNSTDIPNWCNQLRIIVIGGGGGGGGGSGDPGGWSSQDVGVSGSGGGGGGLVAGIINISTYAPPYSIVVGTGGAGGANQGTAEAAGNGGSAGNTSSFKYATNTTIMSANGGSGGLGGTDPNSSTNTQNGVSGGTGSANITVNSTIPGNASNGSGNGSAYNITNNPYGGPSQGGTVNYGTNIPQIATNLALTTAASIERPEISNWNTAIAGYGQGGMGGINASNSNGYAGQPGGGGLVRVYFIK